MIEKRIIIGVDPGLSGAIALYDTKSKRILEVFDMPIQSNANGTKKFASGAGIGERLRNYNSEEFIGAVVEEVAARPGQGVVSMFSFGFSTGVVTGVIEGMGIKVHRVQPAVWKMLMGCNFTKDLSRLRAKGLFPEQKEMFERKKDDGRAEACMLAKFGERIFK